MSCAGRIAVITGASRGIGQAIAVRLAAEGAKVAVVGRDAGSRNADLVGTLDETLDMIARVGGEAVAVRADIGDPACDKAALVADVERQLGDAPDILVHSAAAPREFANGGALKRFDEMPRDWFERSVNLNVWAYWDLIKAVVPGMRRKGAGWLLGISSIQAWPRPLPTAEGAAINKMGGAPLYGGTKAFLDRITTGAAAELFDDNIAVNNLVPTGAIRTPTSDASMAELPPEYYEPMETFVEAALALVTGNPRERTSRIVLSLPFLAELGRPVRTLDGSSLFKDWQPDVDDPRKQMQSYLAGH